MTLPFRLELTAAAPSKDLLSIVTLSWNGSHFYLLPSRTTFIEMQSDHQAAVQETAKELWDFFASRNVSELLVRRGPGTGPHQASTGSTKFETILQLLPLTCPHITVQKVTGWVCKENWLLPLPQSDLSARAKNLQQQAIQTAAYGLGCVLERAQPTIKPEKLRFRLRICLPEEMRSASRSAWL